MSFVLFLTEIMLVLIFMYVMLSMLAPTSFQFGLPGSQFCLRLFDDCSYFCNASLMFTLMDIMLAKLFAIVYCH